jgi:hypothetical protein
MTIPVTDTDPPLELVRDITRDLIGATVTLGEGDDLADYRTAKAITAIAVGTPSWQVTAVAAGLVRKIAGRTSTDDRTDDPGEAAHLLRQARQAANHGLFTRTVTFSDARVMLALIDMAEAVDREGYLRTVDLAQKWELRWHIIEVWRLQQIACQLIWLVAQFSGNPLALLQSIIDDFN